MFCPKCKDEFRSGFTRCAGCNVDLVDDLAAAEAALAADPASEIELPPENPVPLADYCGFFSLDDAREARDRLRPARIRSEIVIRESPEGDRDAAPVEEYWIRVETSRAKEVGPLLSDVGSGDGQPGETFSCSSCGQSVAVEASSCPRCSARFEDD